MRAGREGLIREVAGTILCLAGVLLGIAIGSYSPLDPSLFSAGADRVTNLLGVVGAFAAGVVVGLFGLSSLVIPALMVVGGWRLLRGSEPPAMAVQTAAWTAVVAFGGALLTLVLGRTPYRGGTVEWGGEVGRLVLVGLTESLGLVGAVLVSVVGFVAGTAFGIRGSLVEAVAAGLAWLDARRGAWAVRRARLRDERERERRRRELMKRHRDKLPPPPVPPLVLREVKDRHGFHFRRLPAVRVEEEAAAPTGDSGPGGANPPLRRVGRVRAQPVQEMFSFMEETPATSLPERSMLLPAPPAPEVDPQQRAAMRELVEAKCREFRVEGKVEEVLPGPVITTFEFRPAAGVKYAQIVALEEDLALGLQVEAVRIERIPGKATVGIEVPNPDRHTIVLKEILESSRFVHSASPLTLALGTDIHGHPFVADLARMPHLLIGGFTGSGKSVGINAMIMSILFKATPEEVRFILIDPKMVELGIYEKLPHLLTPIISDPKVAARALRWAVATMRERFQLLAACKVRNIAQYNALVSSDGGRREASLGPDGEPLRPFPFIVIIIDELADLMMTCPAEVEDSIGHLSQMARAVGIHLVFATQRPSVDVITGVVKANFPCRIAYKVRTRFDSRTILDTDGAECLLGMGDMLYLAPGTSRPVRIHGPLVREEEILTVLKHLRRLGKPEFDPRVVEEQDSGGVLDGEEFEDPMYEQAARLVVASRKASASYIQRKLRLGYARSARLLDMMEQRGVIGRTASSRGWDVLVPPDYFGPVDAAGDSEGGEEDDD